MDTTNDGDGGGGGGGPWESIQEDIFHLILEKFSNLQDLIRVSLVCKSWRSVAESSILHRWEKKKLPLLIVPYVHKVGGGGGGGGGGCNDTLGFVSLLHDDDDDDDDERERRKYSEVYKLHLPEIADRRICGSSEGWLITIHENTQVQLLNPITRVLVNLPPLITAFPGFVGKVDFEKGICYVCLEEGKSLLLGYDSNYFRESFFHKVVTNAAANNNSTITTTTTTTTVPTMVMAIYGPYRRLAFCRPSSSSSTGIEEQNSRWICCHKHTCYEPYEDVTFYKGNFYAVHIFGGVVVVKGLDGPSPFLESIIEQEPKYLYVTGYKNYLVESSGSSGGGGGGGDLLKVMRRIEDTYEEKRRPYRTTGFRVFKLNFNGGGPSWEEVTDLGEDCALFIGYNHSFSFSGGCKRNCIYFTDNKMLGKGYDMGVFDLENGRIGSIEEHNSGTTSSMPPAFWYVPRASTSLPALSNNNCVEKQREMKKQQGLLKVFSQTPKSTSYIPSFRSAAVDTSLFTAVNKKNKLLEKMKKSVWLFKAFTKTPTQVKNLFKVFTKTSMLKKKLPLLIVPYDLKGDGSNKERRLGSSTVCNDTLGFISLFHGDGDHNDDDDDDDELNKKKKEEVYKLHLPEIEDRRICGSSEGWLVTVHENGEIQLLNPFSKVLVHLPPLTAFPEVVAKFVSEEIAAGTLVPEDQRGLCYLVSEKIFGKVVIVDKLVIHGSHHFREFFLNKVVTNTTTTTDANSTTTVPTVVMAIYGCFSKLAFCRPTSSSTGNGIDEKNKWISCLEGDEGGWQDVTFYKGNFYAVSRARGHVSVVKGLDGPSPFLKSIIQGPKYEGNPAYMKYLVESSGGDLLKVMRSVEIEVDVESEEEEVPYRTIGFRVLKLDFNRRRPSWVEVTNLGEDALFIGYNHSFSFSVSKFHGGCRGNCIYFTDNNHRLIYENPNGGHDMGVYNLEDGSFEKFDETSSQLFMPPPIWYVPN